MHLLLLSARNPMLHAAMHAQCCECLCMLIAEQYHAMQHDNMHTCLGREHSLGWEHVPSMTPQSNYCKCKRRARGTNQNQMAAEWSLPWQASKPAGMLQMCAQFPIHKALVSGLKPCGVKGALACSSDIPKVKIFQKFLHQIVPQIMMEIFIKKISNFKKGGPPNDPS